MTQIGKKLEDFSVKAFHKGQFKTVSRKDLEGKWSVIFFYPADFTFVCPTELKDLADHYPEFQKEGVEIYSVSTDSHYVHKAWHDDSESIAAIQFPMLGDPAGHLSKSLGVYVESSGEALRGTFVVDPEGVIRAEEVHDMGIGRNAAELLRKVQAAKFVAENDGEVCPANWRPGAATLKPGIELVGKI